MGIALRSYQQDALNITLGAIPVDKTILVQMATGAGKTIYFAKLIETILNRWTTVRIGVLAHRRELITQAQDKLLTVWPDAPIGIACASTYSKVETDAPVTIGSVQTLARRVGETAPFDLIIVDEAHRIPPINKPSQYSTWIEAMNARNNKVRILGVTATPFRLGHGYIYGDECKAGNKNLFNKLHYAIGIKDLQTMGFLCDYRAKQAVDISNDLKTVKVSGDYAIDDLSNLMIKEQHIDSAVDAVQEHASDRKRIVVFAVTIEHAETLKKSFASAGYKSAVVHSKMSLSQRDNALQDFEAGKIRVLCNVMVLSEGWDSPATDCIVLCRPTKSPALFVQMTGRGLRPHQDKKDVLILDLAGNCKEHGDPNSPIIRIPGGKTIGSARTKTCPNCTEMISGNIKVCPVCGHEFPEVEIVEAQYKGMKDVKFQKEPDIIRVEVEKSSVQMHLSKKLNEVLKLSLTCIVPGSIIPIFVDHFFMFDGHPYAVEKTARLWWGLIGTDPPSDVDEAYDRRGEILMSIPEEIEIIKEERWWNVHNWRVDHAKAA